VGIGSVPVDTTASWVDCWYNSMASYCGSNLNWTVSDLGALEVGVKSIDGIRLEAGQLYVKVFYTSLP